MSVEPSNAERFKRGLRPKTPARLYDPSRIHSAPKARLSNTATTPSHDTNRYYNLDHCYPDKSGSATGVSITATSDQDAVDQCAQKNNSGNGSTFLVQYISGTQYMCYSGDVGAGGSTACTQSNYAQYALSA